MSGGFWNDREVRAAIGLGDGDDQPAFGAISTDTRSVAPGDLFVALKGPNFDGHAFVAKAAEAGALGAVVSDETDVPEGFVQYRVEDTLHALGQLGAYRRSRLNARVVGVVGSNGKTTTKELLSAVLQTRFRTHATQGNLNNQVGVPLTLLAMAEDTDIAVVEMGTNSPGEIALLAEIVKPDIVAITAIGEEHLELLGDLDGVLEEETAVLGSLAADGKAYVAEEPAPLPRRARELVGRNRVRVVGLGEGAEIRPDGGTRAIRVLEDGSTLWRWRGLDVRLPIPGRFNVRNALIALGVGLELGIPAQEAVRALSTVRLPKLRSEWHAYGHLRVLADCYNSNPPSLTAVIDLLGSLPTRGRRVAVLGTMRELGSAAAQLHASAADRIVRQVGDRIDLVVATGDFVEAFERHRPKLGEQLIFAVDPVEAYEKARLELRATDTILLKASRGDQLERWLPLLERDFGSHG
ncbi:MAG: UDP-N-acetylmuramoyl-tripeptide--D-alanyl-D-alanine ligase [Gemmatimonas sp.]|nr:UDP-N-acetylmuramoyl-tripeptide--D-alanyl-D-alanine ligase [Gemmatimonas sp.]